MSWRTVVLTAALVTSPAVAATALAATSDRPIPAGVSSSSSSQATARACTLGTRLRSWSTARLAAQTLVVPVDEGGVGAVTGEIALGVGGIILFGSDATSALSGSIAALDAHAPGGVRPAVMVDEEGGEVQRLANLVGSLPSARTMGATLSTAQIAALGRREGKALTALGVTIDLAPVLDLDAAPGPNAHDADGTRSFSVDPNRAFADAAAFASGLQAGGVVPVYKHFPGLGGASTNTDLAPATTVGIGTLRRAGLVPFEKAIASGAPAIMVSNASIPGLTTTPASISTTAITTLLRNELGFRGLVITDDLAAPSVTPKGGSLAHSVVAAIGAGADVVLFGSTAASVAPTTATLIAAITAAVNHGTISRSRMVTAVGRFLTVKHELPPCPS